MLAADEVAADCASRHEITGFAGTYPFACGISPSREVTLRPPLQPFIYKTKTYYTWEMHRIISRYGLRTKQ